MRTLLALLIGLCTLATCPAAYIAVSTPQGMSYVKSCPCGLDCPCGPGCPCPGCPVHHSDPFAQAPMVASAYTTQAPVYHYEVRGCETGNCQRVLVPNAPMQLATNEPPLATTYASAPVYVSYAPVSGGYGASGRAPWMPVRHVLGHFLPRIAARRGW